MPVPYPEPHLLPVVMCEIPGCPYRRRCPRGEYQHICMQHSKMFNNHGTFDRALNRDSVEYKYTGQGYPLADSI